VALSKPNQTRSSDELKQLVEQARKASELLKALSHETRLLMLCLLAEGEKSVSELEDMLDMPQAAVSQQLARLRLDRLVVTRRDGRTIYYAIASKEVASVVETLHDLFCKPARDQGAPETDDLVAK
jgi:DNA-binding transcriptional ArsR family regulator